MNEDEILRKISAELGIKKSTKLPLGISNTCYLLDDNYVLKISDDDSFPLCTDYILQNSANSEGLCPEVLTFYSTAEYQVSRYQKGLRSIPLNQLNNDQLNQIVSALETFHRLPFDRLPSFSVKELATLYSEMDPSEYSEFILPLPELPGVEKPSPVHLDLVEGNILFNAAGQVQLIDYDLAIAGAPYLDLISLLSENELYPEQITLLIARFFHGDSASINRFTKALPLLTFYFDLLWYSWARARAKRKPVGEKEPFQRIAALKKDRLDEFIETSLRA